jgi:hypothetical protein
VVALGIVVGSTAVNAFLMTTPAYAAPSKDKVIERRQSSSGEAVWEDIRVEVPGVGTVTFARITFIGSEVDKTTDVHAILITEEGVEFFAEGFTTIDQILFETDKKLTSATLSPVTLEVGYFDEFDNFITTEITVQATWEGTGYLDQLKLGEHFKSDNFSFKSKASIVGRDATAEGSINNANLGTADRADLLYTKVMEMTVSESIIS